LSQYVKESEFYEQIEFIKNTLTSKGSVDPNAFKLIEKSLSVKIEDLETRLN
jgi:hypothetical protein